MASRKTSSAEAEAEAKPEVFKSAREAEWYMQWMKNVLHANFTASNFMPPALEPEGEAEPASAE